MTLAEMAAVFNDENNEYSKFDRVTNKKSRRPDMHAFILLDEIVPGDSDMVAGAEHDEIYLETSPETLARAATKEQIIELIRCGLRYDRTYDSFAMFV